MMQNRGWTEIRDFIESNDATVDARGQMTDDAMRALSSLSSITALKLDGSGALTDDGARHIAQMPQLRELDLGGTSITDRALDILPTLPRLEKLRLAFTRVTDAAMPRLAACTGLREVDLMRTPTGDAALRALAGRAKLCCVHTGNETTDDGLALLHELPVFKRWHGGDAEMALLSYDCKPNQLVLRGPFTDRGMKHLAGLDGLFGLDIDDSKLRLTAASLEPLATLPHLQWLACDAKDDWMSAIANLPQLRFLGAQDSTAGDAGFTAPSASQSIEYIWGRRCHNLRTRGFEALSSMPALRALSVSCLNVDDAGIATLPAFPALRELMPMDIPDAGYRHIGQCRKLESLVLMYCRDMTDAATEHIVKLPRLEKYFNSYTQITDRTPQLLATMNSLEEITFDACHRLTDAGVAALARLPRLRELRVTGRSLTSEVTKLFPPGIAVHYSA